VSARLALLAAAIAGGPWGLPAPADAQETHVLLVVGLPGEETYEERFHEWASTIRDAAVERLGIREENLIWLADDPAARIRDRATLTTMRSAVDEIAGRAGPDDRVLFVLIGHGTSSRGEVRFNLSGPDLDPAELGAMLERLAPRPLAVVHTASASGDFVPELSGEGRTIITATRSGRENTETWFAGFFAEALSGDVADLDKDGRISLLEAFEFSRREVARYFEQQNLLATEHALLDDNGDGQGTMEPSEATSDGARAGAFYVGGLPRASASRSDRPAATDDPVLATLYEQQAALEQRIAAHRLRRGQMDTGAYERELEELLVELALKTHEIRAREEEEK